MLTLCLIIIIERRAKLDNKLRNEKIRPASAAGRIFL